ncbi:hypothetical protein [Nonomuraea sp. NPDC050786]|uniref:hypothetical protein n=1 Tax=Nonomuraea sp. NPDC050786 TaxID=3154840 RepID=UPI0033D164D8
MEGRSPQVVGRSPEVEGRSPYAVGRSPQVEGRSRHARRRGGRLRWAVGAVALAGGVAVVLGATGTFSEPLTAASAQQSRVASGPQGQAETAPGRRSGRAESGSGASAQARASELPKSQPPQAAASAAATGAAEPGLVQGSAGPADLTAGGPDPADVDDYKADGPSRHTDQQAAEYFRTHWGPDDAALKRLKDIRTIGGYLRIYTDLPESAGNSSQALTLCKRGLEYLRSLGVARPVVFVQAEFGENGNPVLANILGPSDTSCRVTHPEPD